MRPLEGVRVIELATFFAAPRAALHLADMGAEVIKVEHPVRGDPMRGLRAIINMQVGALNWTFETDNRNKKSLAVDLTQEQGTEVIYKLVEKSDVVISNFLPNVLKKLKLDYESMSKINPRIIFGQTSAWGLKGRDKDRDGFDAIALGRTGIINALGEPQVHAPSMVPGMGDHVTALELAYGIMLALFHRERTGEGQLVHLSLLGSLVNLGSKGLQSCLTAGQDIPPVPRKSAGNPLWNYYQTKDKRWMVLAMAQTDLYWHDVCQALNVDGLEHDPRFTTHDLKYANHMALVNILDEIFATRTLAEWEKAFQGRNIVWGPINTFGQAIHDPQIWDNDYFVKFDHPGFGETSIVGITTQMTKTPGEIKAPAPELGQNTEEILLELGYGWEDIVALKEKKAII